MGYIRAADVLPEQLILEIQKYVDGQMLYIPRKCEEHSRWGEKSGTRENLEKRDRHIFDICQDDRHLNYQKSIICLKRAFRESYGKEIPSEGAKE